MSDLKAALSVSTLTLQPGDSAEVSLSLQNIGPTVDSYRVNLQGLEGSWVFLDGSNLTNLLPNQQTELKMIFQPPPLPTSRAGIYKVGVEVERINSASSGNALREPPTALSIIQELTLVIAPDPSFTFEMTPRNLDSRRNRKARIKLTNTGNLDLNFEVRAEDSDDVLDYRFPSKISLPAGTVEKPKSISFYLEAISRDGRLVGKAQKTEFQVTVLPVQLPSLVGRGIASSAGSQAQWTSIPTAATAAKALSGSYTSHPIVPAWFITLLLAAFTAVLAGMLLLVATLEGNRSANLTAVAQANIAATTTIKDLSKSNNETRGNFTASAGVLNIAVATQQTLNVQNTIFFDKQTQDAQNTSIAEVQGTKTAIVSDQTKVAVKATETYLNSEEYNLLSTARHAFTAKNYKEAVTNYQSYQSKYRLLTFDDNNQLLESYCRYSKLNFDNNSEDVESLLKSFELCSQTRRALFDSLLLKKPYNDLVTYKQGRSAKENQNWQEAETNLEALYRGQRDFRDVAKQLFEMYMAWATQKAGSSSDPSTINEGVNILRKAESVTGLGVEPQQATTLISSLLARLPTPTPTLPAPSAGPKSLGNCTKKSGDWSLISNGFKGKTTTSVSDSYCFFDQNYNSSRFVFASDVTIVSGNYAALVLGAKPESLDSSYSVELLVKCDAKGITGSCIKVFKNNIPNGLVDAKEFRQGFQRGLPYTATVTLSGNSVNVKIDTTIIGNFTIEALAGTYFGLEVYGESEITEADFQYISLKIE